MKNTVCGLAALTVLVLAASAKADEVDDLLKSKARLIFQDDFERQEKDNSKEELGKGWVTNSERRAGGVKQGDLKDGTLAITMAKKADHGVSVRHDAPFDDGIVKVRFRMHDPKGIGFNFNDPKCKSSHAGHICHVGVKPKKVDFRDGKTGVFKKDVREKRLAGAPKNEIWKLVKDKFHYHDVKLKTGQWYEMTILIRGSGMSAWIDGQPVGKLKSAGIDHKVKQNIAFAVSGRADVDNLRVWSLDAKPASSPRK